MNDSIITLKLNGRLSIPGGYTTSWIDTNGLPRMNGTPFIPASQIKAGLRRAAVQAIVQRTGKKLADISSYYFNTVGGSKGKGTNDPKAKSVGLDELQALRDKNPICGLFGGTDVLPGANFYAGRIYVANAIPGEEYIVGTMRGARCDDSRRDPETMMGMISPEGVNEDLDQIRRDNQRRTSLKADIKAEKAKFKKGMTAEERKVINDAIHDLEKQLDAIKGNSVTMPLAGFPYVLAESFKTSMTLMHVTLVELGMLLVAMDTQMKNEPFMGGHRSSGMGEFSASWTDDQNRIVLEPFQGITIIEGDLFHKAITAFEQALPRFDLNQNSNKAEEGADEDED